MSTPIAPTGDSPVRHPTRRGLLGGGLLLGMTLMPAGRASAAATPVGPLRPNAFVRIGTDDLVTIIVKHIEMGQGIATGLATVVADELDADWSQVRIEFAPNNDALYKNLFIGTMASGGSTGMANSWTQMRRAGAGARAMLVEAAAKRWGVPAADVTVSQGVVTSGAHSARFGALVEAAAGLTPPAEPVLKTPDRFTLIGKHAPKLDTTPKTDGTARFTMDVALPGMVQAVIEHPPVFGGKVATVSDAAALAIPGVLAVKQVPTGVVVYAKDFYTALRGRAALEITWDLAAAETRSSAQLFAAAEAAVQTPGKLVVDKGDVATAYKHAKHKLEATYRFPYLAHAPMEPLDAVMHVVDGHLDVWMGSQFQVSDTNAIAKELGIPAERATLHECFAGGSFGRRATLGLEFAREAGTVYKAWAGPEPVKFAWTRENDIAGGFYRPQMVHKLRAGVDAHGKVAVWDQVVAGQSFVFGSPMEAMAVKRGFDSSMVEGSFESGYGFDTHRLGFQLLESKVPTNWWRSVGHSHNTYVVETFVDELLAMAKQDAVQGRLALIEDPRLRGVLTRVAELSGWGRTVPKDRALGLAVAKAFKSYTAQVVELSRGADGLPKVHKVWCAVDCGIAVNPDVIRAQVEGGVGFALGHILYGQVTLGEGGVVDQRNFDRYRSLRIHEMPAVEVAIVASDKDPTGIGEPGVPPLGPAVANAWRKLTGVAVRNLPFTNGGRA